MNGRASTALSAVMLATASLGIVSAEQLQRLHVSALALTTDISRPAAGERFHLIIALRVREPSLHAQTVQLPSFGGLEELGDERSTVSGPRGTDYRETLTLVAPTGGRFHVSPASFDAIDAADGKPKRFVSNALTIVVGSPGDKAATMSGARALLVLAVALALPALAWFVFARRAPRTESEKPVELAEVAPARSADYDLRTAVLALRERRDRASALLLRSALWRFAGAAPGETLADILQRPAASNPRTRAVLVSAERAAFVQNEQVAEAIALLVAETDAGI